MATADFMMAPNGWRRIAWASIIPMAFAVWAFAVWGVIDAPASAADPAKPTYALLQSTAGVLKLRLDWVNAPESCAAFVRYTRLGYYAKTAFDDADEFALFGGKPSMSVPGMASNGNMACSSGPVGEFKLPNVRGAVGFRRTVGSCNPEKRSNCTQIYLRTADKPQSNGEFTIFARLEDSEAVLEKIQVNLEQKTPVPFSVELAND